VKYWKKKIILLPTLGKIQWQWMVDHRKNSPTPFKNHTWRKSRYLLFAIIGLFLQSIQHRILT